MDGALNITRQLSEKYPVAKMIFPNKTLILVTRSHSASSSQQMALLAGMAFIGGIVAGLLIRCIYHGIVQYFMSSMDQLAVSEQRPRRTDANSSFAGANDFPPDYATVMTQTPPTDSVSEDSKLPEDSPPTYVSIVPDGTRVARSATA